jgi:hypothetical protein
MAPDDLVFGEASWQTSVQRPFESDFNPAIAAAVPSVFGSVRCCERHESGSWCVQFEIYPNPHPPPPQVTHTFDVEHHEFISIPIECDAPLSGFDMSEGGRRIFEACAMRFRNFTWLQLLDTGRARRRDNAYPSEQC